MAQRGAAWPIGKMLGVCFLLALLLPLGRNVVRLFQDCSEAAAYPFELDYGEGPLLEQTLRLMRLEPLYRPIEEAPYTITNHPPVYHLISGLAGKLLGDTLAAGRLVSFAAVVLTALLLGVISWRAAEPGGDAWTRWLAAAVAALLFLSSSYVAVRAPLLRVDLLAQLFAVAGVLIFVARPDRPLAAAVAFLLAIYTDETAVAGAAAVLIVASVFDRRRALRFLVLLLGGGLLALLVLSILSEGNFWFHAVTANGNRYSWPHILEYVEDVVRHHPVELALAAVTARPLLAPLRRKNRPIPPVPGSWDRAVLGTYLITSFLVSLTTGKVGFEVNDPIQFIGVVCACVGVAITRALVVSAGGAAAVAVPALLFVEVVAAPYRGTTVRPVVPDWREQAQIRQVLEMLRETPPPVLSEDMTLLVLAGHPIELQPLEMTQLARRDLWNPSPFLRRLAAREFRLITLRFDARHPPETKYSRFPEAVLKLIRSRYELSDRIDGYWMYRPAP